MSATHPSILSRFTGHRIRRTITGPRGGAVTPGAACPDRATPTGRTAVGEGIAFEQFREGTERP
ncbi:hypothetical protein [Streptomyces sp. NPDC088847]|uniref:hypothetical protein n=1 Tax=Streptomyces sp. NPDC088847 TaxID=3365909 RepID=UPI0037FB53F5